MTTEQAQARAVEILNRLDCHSSEYIKVLLLAIEIVKIESSGFERGVEDYYKRITRDA